MDTIVALSSGQPPAAIGVVRLSGTGAFAAAEALVGTLPPPRRASLRTARDEAGAILDWLLVLAFPGPATATGEDLIELHCHGGRATVDAILATLVAMDDVRPAEAGEFTRRALLNGVIDLAQAEGLADLLQAETENQRRYALAAVEGRVSRLVWAWLDRIARLSALIEAVLDFADEGDVEREAALVDEARRDADGLRREMAEVLAAPQVERVRDGLRVVIAGPPNAGKSTLLNLLSQADAAIVSPIAGTTRDRVEVPVRRNGIAYRLTDTAGLTETDDAVEQIGVDRALAALETAELILWLGDDPPPRSALWVHARADLPGRQGCPAGRDIAISATDDATIERLWTEIGVRTAGLLPLDQIALSQTQRVACATAMAELKLAEDPLIAGEQLRLARNSLARVLGMSATETMLDALFSRFCIGK